MYNDLVRDNVYNKSAKFVYYDNNVVNTPITERYNHFLNNYDYNYDDWFIFCHEDWQVKKAWLHHFKKLDHDSVYGICGTVLEYSDQTNILKYFLGQIENCNKDGSQLTKFGKWAKTGAEVITFDCMCIIIHSTLVKKHNIRFDENLSWHLYAEELNIRLKEEYGIKSRILQIYSKHWSYGAPMPNADFDAAFNYLACKFRNVENIYSATATGKYLGGANGPVLNIKTVKPDNFWSFLFKTKVTKDGKLRVKIFNITVFSIKAGKK